MNSKLNNLLVIILAYNEENSITGVISDIKESSKDAKIAVINDGSSDNTAKYAIKEDVVVLSHSSNMGIGVSFQTGCQFASLHNYDYIVRIDADGQHNPRFIQDILNPLIDDEADIVIGSRFLGNSEYTSSFFRLIGIRIISFIVSIISKKKITDPTSGFCAMNKKALEFFSKNCPDEFPEPEILIYHKEFRIKEIPVSISKREEGVSSITPLKSIYYMILVLLSLLVHMFKKEVQ